MSLDSRVQARYSTQYLVNISNPQNTSATTVDTTRLGLAVADVEADFKLYAGVAYDDTVDTHVRTGILGVVIYLRMYTGQLVGSELNEELSVHEKRVRSLGKITARNRLSPLGSSILVPSSENRGNTPVRPRFDGPNFDNILPGSPGASDPLIGTNP